jgi:hypothetical protein
MPKKLENKLRREANHMGLTGRKADAYVYGTMNNLGMMHGNKVVTHHSQRQPRHKNGKFQ